MLPPLTDEEVERRLPLWSALSDLFLDTDPTLHHAYLVRTLREAPYTREQLRIILCEEVTPAFRFNLSLIAGEWAGWDLECVRRRVLAQKQRTPWSRWLLGERRRSRSVDAYVQEQWAELVRLWDAEASGLRETAVPASDSRSSPAAEDDSAGR